MFSSYPSRLTFVRHGQSTRNVACSDVQHFLDSEKTKASFAGISDQHVDLTSLGHAQACFTGKALNETKVLFDVAYHSGYKRTISTLNGVLGSSDKARRDKIEVREEMNLREREPGYTFFMTGKEVDALFPWYRDYWNSLGPVYARPIGGESIADLITRVKLAMEKIFNDCRDQKVLISCHGRVLTAARFILEDWTYEELEKFIEGHGPRNCSVTTYEFSPELKKLVLSEYNKVFYTKEDLLTALENSDEKIFSSKF